MKTVKFLSMAVAALMMVACSSDEIESVAQKGNGLMPLEIVPDVSIQTRAAQITTSTLSEFTVNVTGSFVAVNGTEYTDPELAVTKSGDNWVYIYKDATNTTPTEGILYWNGAQTATFSAHTLAAGAIVNEATTQADAIGAYATKTFNGTDNPGAVSLSFKHAVAKMQFKARVQGDANDNVKVKIDIKQVAVRNMKYLSTGYAIPTSAATMGTLGLDGTANPATKDFFTASTSNGYIQLNTSDATATTDLGTLFMLPQTVTAEDLSNATWDDAYIAVLAQVHRVENNTETMIFPKQGAADNISYGWIALPMPAGFTAMAAQKSYVFTLNFSASSLGKIDRSQDPYEKDDPSDPEVNDDPNDHEDTIDPDNDDPDNPNDGFIDPDSKGNNLSSPDAFALAVTVEVNDFGAEGDYATNNNTSSSPDLTTPLTFEAKADGFTVTLTSTLVSKPSLQYSIDGGAWTDFTFSENTATTPSVNTGHTIAFRGNNTVFFVHNDITDYTSTFSCSQDCYLYGNIMSLLSASSYATATSVGEFAFLNLFLNNTKIYSHDTKQLVLPATTLAPNCYGSLFNGCTALTRAPELPATTLDFGCYGRMFYGCTALTTAPELRATTLVNGCYSEMFKGCTSLNSITCLATEISADYCTGSWLDGVAATGTFTAANSSVVWSAGANGIPSGWTRTNAE